ncbi:MAG: queuosine precursor transporter [Pseudomonadales bacterium]
MTAQTIKSVSDTKYHILLGIYVGAWGILPGLTPKLIPLDLSVFGLGMLAFSFGAFMHAITFPCTDVVAEVWGAARARLMVYLGVCVFLIATAFYMIGTRLPGVPDWPLNDAYNSIFATADRMILASLAATCVAQLMDIFVFEKIKQITGQRRLWLRNNLSTAMSQLLDTTIFYTIAFYGVLPNATLPLLIIGTYLVKLLLTAIDTPVVYLLVRWITGHWTAPGDIVTES